MRRSYLGLTSEAVSIEGRGAEHIVHSVGVEDECGVGDVMLSGRLKVLFVIDCFQSHILLIDADLREGETLLEDRPDGLGHSL